jgi:alpha-D-ribose 1-methylphosphonate 5-triphosphate synthase subunit PhnH
MPLTAGTSGLADPVHSAQAVFREVMRAMACPGEIRELPQVTAPPAPLSAGLAAIALTLADYEAPLWLDSRLSGSPEPARFLRFHTGAPIVRDPGEARFALIGAPLLLPPLASFAQGTLEYPDRSATLIVEVASITPGRGFRLKGPGIDGKRSIGIEPLPADFVARMKANRALFPRGVDIVFVAGRAIAALPRTTRLKQAKE